MIKKIFLGLFILSTSVFSSNIEETYNENNSLKYRGIDVLNFYIPIVEQNRFSSSVDSELRDDKNIFEWNMAEGYLSLNELWDFEYDIEKEFHSIKEGNKRDFNGWDNKITFVRRLKNSKSFNKTWSNDFIIGAEQNDINDIGFEVERYKIFTGLRTRTSFENLGKGGTYFGFDLIGKKVLSRDGDGVSCEFDIVSSTNLGYGFQFFYVIYNEYLNYENYAGAYRLGVESYLRWTYEINYNLAFSIDMGLDSDKYFGNTDVDYSSEIYIYPHLLYSYNLNPEFRVFGEIGLPSYKMLKEKSSFYENSKNQGYYYFKIGIEYIF